MYLQNRNLPTPGPTYRKFKILNCLAGRIPICPSYFLQNPNFFSVYLLTPLMACYFIRIQRYFG